MRVFIVCNLRNKLVLSILLSVVFCFSVNAEQFVLFDKTFNFEKKDAIPTKSHLRVSLEELPKDMPKNWRSPHNYADGSVYVYLEVLEKPKGDVKTHWSLCYIANKGQNGSSYAVAPSPHYTNTGTFEITRDMKKLWQKDKVVWEQGIKAVTLVTKASINKSGTKGKAHGHLQPNIDQFFPTKIRVIMVQVSKGSKVDKSKISGLKK